MNTTLTCWLAGLLVAMAGAPACAAWLDSPDNLSFQNIGENIRLNGTPMAIRRFESSQSVEDVVAAFRANWERTRGADEVKRSRLNDWTVLNQTFGDQHRSVQVRDAGPGRVEGMVALTSPQQHRDPVLALRLPSGVETISVVESAESGTNAQQVMAVSRRPVDATLDAVAAELRTGGWTVQARKKQEGGAMLSGSKGDQEVDAIAQTGKAGTLLMLNVVNHPVR